MAQPEAELGVAASASRVASLLCYTGRAKPVPPSRSDGHLSLQASSGLQRVCSVLGMQVLKETDEEAAAAEEDESVRC